jgi:pyrophosphatase PpaX
MKAVLFDVDGTLLNTHEFIVSAFEHAVRSTGRNITRVEAEHYMRAGKDLLTIYAHMLPEEDAELLAERHREYQKSRFHLATAFEGARDTLQKLRDANYKLATVTNRARASVIPTLIQTGLVDFFDTHVCMEDTLRTKPDPEHVMTALRALGRQPEYAWMIGDTPADIEAAHAAGVSSIGISHSRQDPHYVVYSLPEILPIVLD